MKLAKLEKIVKAPVVVATSTTPKINITTNSTGERIVTMVLPPLKRYTEAERRKMEEEKGKDMVAVCDATSEPIFNEKNYIEITSSHPDRQDINGLGFSYAFMKDFKEKLSLSGK